MKDVNMPESQYRTMIKRLLGVGFVGGWICGAAAGIVGTLIVVNEPKSRSLEKEVTSLEIKLGDNGDCAVPELYDSMSDSIRGYDGMVGLSVDSMGRVELQVSHAEFGGFVGYDSIKGMYLREDSGYHATTIFYSEGYVPNGTEMACELAETLLEARDSIGL